MLGPLLISSILYLGDSHSVGPFGWYLDQHFRDAGYQVATYASCGSIPAWWYSGKQTTCGYFSRDLEGNKVEATTHETPKIDDLIALHRPDMVVMEFGGNYLRTPSADFIRKDIKAIVKTVKDSGAACFWITHPDSRANRSEIPRVIALIKEAVGQDCPIFDSTLVTKYPETGGDGTHYWSAQTKPLVMSWAQATFDAFRLSNP